MNLFLSKPRFCIARKTLSLLLLMTFSSTMIMPPAMAQMVLNLPMPGTAVGLTPAFSPALIKGIMIDPNDPLTFDFVIDRGDSKLTEQEFKTESTKLVKYFLASLTVPEKEMWVNLSPYEKDRIIPTAFGQTQMGMDLLAQDYMLKQLTSSLTIPDSELGKKFWDRVYKETQEKFGTKDVPTNTFNKIWIVPQTAQMFENEKGAFIINTHLKVMLDEDYLALEANQNSTQHGLGDTNKEDLKKLTSVQSLILKEILLPAIEKEINEGQIFAQLRQIYHSMLLATWYKKELKDSLLGQVYVDQSKLSGVESSDAALKEKIYNQYVAAFKKGVYDYVKDDYNPKTQEVISRKYFSGGANLVTKEMAMLPETQVVPTLLNIARSSEIVGIHLDAAALPTPQIVTTSDAAMNTKDILRELAHPKFSLETFVRLHSLNIQIRGADNIREAIAGLNVPLFYRGSRVLKRSPIDIATHAVLYIGNDLAYLNNPSAAPTKQSQPAASLSDQAPTSDAAALLDAAMIASPQNVEKTSSGNIIKANKSSIIVSPQFGDNNEFYVTLDVNIDGDSKVERLNLQGITLGPNSPLFVGLSENGQGAYVGYLKNGAWVLKVRLAKEKFSEFTVNIYELRNPQISASGEDFTAVIKSSSFGEYKFNVIGKSVGHTFKQFVSYAEAPFQAESIGAITFDKTGVALVDLKNIPKYIRKNSPNVGIFELTTGIDAASLSKLAKSFRSNTKIRESVGAQRVDAFIDSIEALAADPAMTNTSLGDLFFILFFITNVFLSLGHQEVKIQADQSEIIIAAQTRFNLALLRKDYDYALQVLRLDLKDPWLKKESQGILPQKMYQEREQRFNSLITANARLTVKVINNDPILSQERRNQVLGSAQAILDDSQASSANDASLSDAAMLKDDLQQLKEVLGQIKLNHLKILTDNSSSLDSLIRYYRQAIDHAKKIVAEFGQKSEITPNDAFSINSSVQYILYDSDRLNAEMVRELSKIYEILSLDPDNSNLFTDLKPLFTEIPKKLFEQLSRINANSFLIMNEASIVAKQSDSTSLENGLNIIINKRVSNGLESTPTSVLFQHNRLINASPFIFYRPNSETPLEFAQLVKDFLISKGIDKIDGIEATNLAYDLTGNIFDQFNVSNQSQSNPDAAMVRIQDSEIKNRIAKAAVGEIITITRGDYGLSDSSLTALKSRLWLQHKSLGIEPVAGSNEMLWEKVSNKTIVPATVETPALDAAMLWTKDKIDAWEKDPKNIEQYGAAGTKLRAQKMRDFMITVQRSVMGVTILSVLGLVEIPGALTIQQEMLEKNMTLLEYIANITSTPSNNTKEYTSAIETLKQIKETSSSLVWRNTLIRNGAETLKQEISYDPTLTKEEKQSLTKSIDDLLASLDSDSAMTSAEIGYLLGGLSIPLIFSLAGALLIKSNTEEDLEKSKQTFLSLYRDVKVVQEDLYAIEHMSLLDKEAVIANIKSLFFKIRRIQESIETLRQSKSKTDKLFTWIISDLTLRIIKSAGIIISQHPRLIDEKSRPAGQTLLNERQSLERTFDSITHSLKPDAAMMNKADPQTVEKVMAKVTTYFNDLISLHTQAKGKIINLMALKQIAQETPKDMYAKLRAELGETIKEVITKIEGIEADPDLKDTFFNGYGLNITNSYVLSMMFQSLKNDLEAIYNEDWAMTSPEDAAMKSEQTLAQLTDQVSLLVTGQLANDPTKKEAIKSILKQSLKYREMRLLLSQEWKQNPATEKLAKWVSEYFAIKNKSAGQFELWRKKSDLARARLSALVESQDIELMASDLTSVVAPLVRIPFPSEEIKSTTIRTIFSQLLEADEMALFINGQGNPVDLAQWLTNYFEIKKMSDWQSRKTYREEAGSILSGIIDEAQNSPDAAMIESDLETFLIEVLDFQHRRKRVMSTDQEARQLGQLLLSHVPYDPIFDIFDQYSDLKRTALESKLVGLRFIYANEGGQKRFGWPIVAENSRYILGEFLNKHRDNTQTVTLIEHLTRVIHAKLDGISFIADVAQTYKKSEDEIVRLMKKNHLFPLAVWQWEQANPSSRDAAMTTESAIASLTEAFRRYKVSASIYNNSSELKSLEEKVQIALSSEDLNQINGLIAEIKDLDQKLKIKQVVQIPAPADAAMNSNEEATSLQETLDRYLLNYRIQFKSHPSNKKELQSEVAIAIFSNDLAKISALLMKIGTLNDTLARTSTIVPSQNIDYSEALEGRTQQIQKKPTLAQIDNPPTPNTDAAMMAAQSEAAVKDNPPNVITYMGKDDKQNPIRITVIYEAGTNIKRDDVIQRRLINGKNITNSLMRSVQAYSGVTRITHYMLNGGDLVFESITRGRAEFDAVQKRRISSKIAPALAALAKGKSMDKDLKTQVQALIDTMTTTPDFYSKEVQKEFRRINTIIRYTGLNLDIPQDRELILSFIDKNVGGIDFNPNITKMNIQKSGAGIQFNVTPADVERLRNVPGFIPVIINVTPAVNLPIILGLNTKDFPQPIKTSKADLMELGYLDKVRKPLVMLE